MDDGSTKKQCRVSGKIFTDDWELPMLQKKFQKIISERVLSGNLQNICQLEDRPMIRRFFCKTSRDMKNKKRNVGIHKLKTSASLRTLKDETTPTDPAIITPTTKPISKKTESASESAAEREREREKEREKQKQKQKQSEPSPSPSPNSPLNNKGKRKRKGSETGTENEGGSSSSSSSDSNSSSSSSSSGKHAEGDRKSDTTMPPRTPDDQCECFCIVL